MNETTTGPAALYPYEELTLDNGLRVITVEDHSIAGGFGSAVLETAQELGVTNPRIRRLGIPQDRWIAHGSRTGQLAECGLDATGIASAVQSLMEEHELAVSSPTMRGARSYLSP